MIFTCEGSGGQKLCGTSNRREDSDECAAIELEQQQPTLTDASRRVDESAQTKHAHEWRATIHGRRDWEEENPGDVLYET